MRAVIDIRRSQSQVLLVSASPVAFDLHIDLWLSDSEHPYSRVLKHVKITYAHQLLWHLFVDLLHLGDPCPDIDIYAEIDVL